MMKKLSNFVVNKRVAILAVMLVLAIVGAICSGFVGINEDMTKYLPDDSNMKAGMDIMTDAFPEMETSNAIRVMFDDLTDADKSVILEKLKAIRHVDSVDYDPTSEDYNKENHTLFVINMSCDYGSAEEQAIEAALESEFSNYTVVWQNNDTSTPGIPAMVIIIVMIMIFVILFIMCGSWFDPFLFLITIGIAVVINSGTNIFLGEIAGVTKSIAALLQMALSMDYSIIMMNRYRQERKLEANKFIAMKNAWVNAFASVSASSLTTVVGLLMLVFMSFKIGANLGIVLAKGVFISMVCVITVLPALILICDRILIKTAKSEPHIPMEWAAKFSHKFRLGLTAVFIVLFAGFYILQSYTGIAYTLVKDDAVAHVFPKSNTLVVVYENKDEEKLGNLIDKLENDKNVTSVMGYGTVLGKPYTSNELVGVIGEMSSDITLNSAMINMLYYHYYNNGEVGTMTIEEFLSFISETVVNDDMFAGYINEDMMANMDRIGMFANKAELQKQRVPAELAAMLGIDESMVQTIFVLHNAQDVSDKTMSLAQFTGFLNGGLLSNPAFANSFDAQTIAQLQMMDALIQLAASGQSLTSAQMAQTLGMEEATVGQLYYLYFSTNLEFQQEVASATMTLPAFLALLKANTPADQQAQLAQMEMLIGVAVSGVELTATELSAITGMPEQQIGQLLAMQGVEKMTLSAFLDTATVFAPTNAQLQQLKQMVGLATSGIQLDSATLAGVFGMQQMQVMQLFGMNLASQKSIPFAQFTAFLVNDVMTNNAFSSYFGEEQKVQLATMNQLAQLAALGIPLDAKTLAGAFGMEESMANMVFRLYFGGNIAGKTLSLEETVDFILLDPVMKGYMDAEMLGQLQMMQGLIRVAVNEVELTAAQMGNLFAGLTDGFDPVTLEIMYLFAESIQNADPTWTMTLETLFNHMVDKVVDDARFAPFIDDEMKASLLENKVTLDDGKKQLVGDKYSRLVITTTYLDESEATTAFLNDVEAYFEENMSGETYLIGESAMSHEMRQIFDTELTFITLLTALAIFVIVMFTFKSISIPLILVLLVQCGVYITVTVTGILSGEIYYLALLIVECILMGATIDYGILFTNYYCEHRQTMGIKDALVKAYEGSIHTIMTSGLILVSVTAVVGGMFEDATVSAIVRTISIGSFCAIVLILVILPGILAACDRLVVKKKRFEDIDQSFSDEYSPISALGYFIRSLFYAIPVLGWLVALINAFAAKNRNGRNFARACLGTLVATILAAVVLEYNGFVVWEPVQEMFQQVISALKTAQ